MKRFYCVFCFILWLLASLCLVASLIGIVVLWERFWQDIGRDLVQGITKN